MTGRRVYSAALAAAAAIAALGPGEARAGGGEPMNLLQLAARSELIVHVRVREGSLRFASVDVLEAIRGRPPLPQLRIAFRDFNFERPAGEEAIVFTDGEEEVLFLVPYMKVRRKPKNRDLYELFQGAEGRWRLPAEGAGILLGAVRVLASVAALDPASQVDRLRALLTSDNPLLLETALAEILRLRALDPDLYPRLSALARQRSPSVRGLALRGLAVLFRAPAPDPDRAEDPALIEAPRQALAVVLERAHADDREEVRVEAVRALAAWPVRREVDEALRAIAAGDPDQTVRFAAQAALVFGGAGR